MDTFDNGSRYGAETTLADAIRAVQEINRERRRPIFCRDLDEIRAAAERYGLRYVPPQETQPATIEGVPVHIDPHLSTGMVYRLIRPIPTREEALRELLTTPLFRPLDPLPITPTHGPYWRFARR
jgi:hypothetical protein